MFSDMTRGDFSRKAAVSTENVLDILHRTGISVLWKENDGGCKGVCNRLPVVSMNAVGNKKLCNGRTCYDGVLLDNVDENITPLTGNDKMIVFHMIGSHGPTYFERYSEEHRFFVPDCPRSDIENCTNEELVNTYDNTIRYTDYVLSEMIKKLKEYSDKYRTVLLYVSDHGESLGEYGVYLHGTPYKMAPDQQTQVPLLLWMSPEFISPENKK
ncbi:sulfatase-like hydrolase/transferase [Escherichia coli]|nr:sulfatase-like hydrolase/transferase [Escherichia coli]